MSSHPKPAGTALAVVLLLTMFGAVWAQRSANGEWVASWSAAPAGVAVVSANDAAANHTFRNVIRISAGGNQIRVAVTNEFGREPLVVGAASVALGGAKKDGTLLPGSVHVLTFGGSASVVLPAGAWVFSDVVAMQTPPLSTLAISIFVAPQPDVSVRTCHVKAWSSNFAGIGDLTRTATLPNATRYESWCFLRDVDVRAREPAEAIVAFGDSITDGGHSTVDANHRYPDFLAERILACPRGATVSVINEGMGSNRILHDGIANPGGLSRFDRDVLSHDGVRYVVLLEGINDLGRLSNPIDRTQDVDEAELLTAFRQMIDRAHQHGIRVIGGTLTPYEGASYFTEKGEGIRQALNSWIRSSGAFDEVVDFDSALRDPQHPRRYLPAYDNGDHLHPSDAGYKAMAAAFSLQWFLGPCGR